METDNNETNSGDPSQSKHAVVQVEAGNEQQETLVRKQRLTTLGLLVGGVAHEIRNPLGVIRNAIYFLQHALHERDPNVNDAVNEIVRSLGKAELIVRDLLDYAGGRPPKAAPFSLDDALAASLKMVFVPPSILVLRQVTSEVHINADQGQIERLLSNLIQNAVQAMPNGGTLSLIGSLDRETAKIQVVDTGCGIAQDELETIFEPLFTKRAKGIGLGLSLCLHYAKQNHGSLGVHSDLGNGTTFTVILPALA